MLFDERSEFLPFKNLLKEKNISRTLRFISVAFFILAAALSFLLVFVSLPWVQKQLNDINIWFYELELYIGTFDKLSAVGVILLLFVIRTFFPVIPFTVLFIGTGLVFSVPIAATINVVGFIIMVSIGFFWGRRFGGGNAHKLILKSKTLLDFMEFKGKGNKWMLTILRFVPVAPVGTVSKAYGATNMSYLPYVFFSVLGFLPRIISWSVVGCNIYNPLTPGFLAPFIILSLISGVSLLLLDTLFKLVK